MALSDVSNILWRERRLLELLLCKLEEQQRTRPTGAVENVLGESRRPFSRRRMPRKVDACRLMFGLADSTSWSSSLSRSFQFRAP